MNLGSVLAAVFRRDWTMMKRYMVNSISSLVSIYMIFMLIFAGLQSVSSTRRRRARRLARRTIVGFFVWTFTIYAFSNLSRNLINEAQTMRSNSSTWPRAGSSGWARHAHVRLCVQLRPIMLLLFAMMATTGRWLRVDMVSLVPCWLSHCWAPTGSALPWAAGAGI